jgi:predicted RNA methylase
METTQTKQMKGLKRNTIDKYYTKNDTVDMCLQYVKQNIDITSTDLIIEPSAGNGSFIASIKKLCNNYRFYDIQPEHPEIVQQDYLLLNYSEFTDFYSKIHIIGNPPFGRQSSILIKFIKKSCEFCNSICFILPKSFKKDSLKKKFPLNFHLLFEIDIPENSFLVNNKNYTVPCIFQIWQKKAFNRQIISKLIPKQFIFVRKDENPDISVRRVGVNAGTITINICNKNTQTHYFIKFTNMLSLDENLKILSKMKYTFNNTVGPKSISKQELIDKFNSCYD